MIRGVRHLLCGAVTAALAFLPDTRMQAQATGRVAVEAVASASTTTSPPHDPFLIFDAVGTVRIGRGWDLVVRPYARRLPGGDWALEMYQLQLRYVSSTKVPFRVDAGIISSPLGLSTLELRPDRNPLIGSPFYYFVPLPPINGRFDRLHVLSSGYPLGAIFSMSGDRWDARAGVTDGTPARPRSMFNDARFPAEPQVVAGAGVTPVTGLRLGAGVSRGRYRSSSTTGSGAAVAPQTASVFNLEGEYALGYTRISAEWVRNRFTTPLGDAVAQGFNLQASRTFSPRWFAAARATRASSPVVTTADDRRASTSFESTLGYRLTRELTVRGGFQASRRFTAANWEHAAVMSVVWAKRWW